MLCLDIIKAVEKERGKSPVLSQSFRFEDLRCDRRIRDIYIYIIFIYCIYIYINNIYIYIWLDESQLEPERVVYLFTNVLVVGGLHLLWCTILAQVGFHAFVLYLFYPPSHTLYYGGSYLCWVHISTIAGFHPLPWPSRLFTSVSLHAPASASMSYWFSFNENHFSRRIVSTFSHRWYHHVAFLLGSMGTYSHISDTYSSAFAFWWGKLRPSDVGFKYG